MVSPVGRNEGFLPPPMRKLIAQSCFIYGGVASTAALVWYLAGLAGHAKLPQSVWVAESFFAIHAIAMVITFHRSPTRARPALPRRAFTCRACGTGRGFS